MADDCQDDNCGGPVTAARSDARFCSNACRQRAYRRRQQMLKRYGSWENALSESVTALDRIIRNEGDRG